MALRDNLALHWKRRDAAWLKGWDSALINPELAFNPYRRRDFRDSWADGREMCLANHSLPEQFRR